MVELFVRRFYCGEGCMKLGHGSCNYTGKISTEIPNETLRNVKEINAYRLAVCSVFCQYYYLDRYLNQNSFNLKNCAVELNFGTWPNSQKHNIDTQV